jgi:hypothetical protein
MTSPMIEATATTWRASATPAQLAAFSLFRDAGCPSCGDAATPGCACWTIREPRYVAIVGGAP